MRVLLIDNYDSFTYNIVHYLEGFDCEVDVFFNNKIPFEKLEIYNKIVLSPGPKLPIDAGDLMKLIELYHTKKPILGICLGFQALVEFFGGELYNQNKVKHGVKEGCFFNNQSLLFKNIQPEFNVGLYHSWAADKKSFPSCLKITGETKNEIIMSFEHQSLPICGVQFHPESILTENGHQIIRNFLVNF